MAVATEHEMKALAQEMRARVIEAEAEVPRAMAEAFRSGNLGIMDYYKMTDSDLYQEVYRSRSLALGRQIKVITPEGEKEALALDIDADCHLIVRYEDGSTASLTSGEISIRL